MEINHHHTEPDCLAARFCPSRDLPWARRIAQVTGDVMPPTGNSTPKSKRITICYSWQSLHRNSSTYIVVLASSKIIVITHAYMYPLLRPAYRAETAGGEDQVPKQAESHTMSKTMLAKLILRQTRMCILSRQLATNMENIVARSIRDRKLGCPKPLLIQKSRLASTMNSRALSMFTVFDWPRPASRDPDCWRGREALPWAKALLIKFIQSLQPAIYALVSLMRSQRAFLRGFWATSWGLMALNSRSRVRRLLLSVLTRQFKIQQASKTFWENSWTRTESLYSLQAMYSSLKSYSSKWPSASLLRACLSLRRGAQSSRGISEARARSICSLVTIQIIVRPI